ncbi:alpha/beta hydrolase [Phytomonospora endophytica]|uniref:Acyl-CoA:diacylglycerol acyltransferase n=1 Tax=Phytomonospora endophytica TaxID=714109 RepID=A0A841FDW7_9ACTN|nr:alpha/beta fold hydrolase [Phytomonospora endophytica]MBB6034014.1 acetyl esterase/lipase [Phytomonospora endophytica]
MPTRRKLLIAGGAAAGLTALAAGLVEARVLPGRATVHEFLGLTGEDGVVPDIEPGERLTGSFVSAAIPGTETAWAVALPPGRPADGLPVAVYLHGRGADHRHAETVGLGHFLAAAVGAGVPPFALAAVDGGADGFWHPRASGDPERMIVEEFLPRLSTLGLSTARIGLLGHSMGGFGALSVAGRHRDTVAAAVAVSPAIWRGFDEAQPGAFDDVADFDRHDLFTRRPELAGLPLRVDCGNDDPFAPNVADYLDGLPDCEGGMTPGLHTDGFLRRVAPAGLAFLGERLAR